jgi:4-hydroxy-3-polyprenylbenzoate decarboxylase
MQRHSRSFARSNLMADSAITTSLSRSAFGCPNDVRSFIALLEQAGELRRVTTEVDWRYEAGAMSRLVTERRGPAPLFERVKDYPDQQIAAVLFGPSKPNLHSRVALALGLAKATPPLTLIEEIRQRLKVQYPRIVIDRKAAACKEVVVAKEDINLERLAVPWIKEIDGGRFLGTSCIVVCKDPDSEWVNCGTYRCQLIGPQEFAVLLIPGGPTRRRDICQV